MQVPPGTATQRLTRMERPPFTDLKLSFKAGIPFEQVRKVKLIKMEDFAQSAGCRVVI